MHKWLWSLLGGALPFAGDRFWPQVGYEQLQKRAPAPILSSVQVRTGLHWWKFKCPGFFWPREPLILCFSHTFRRWVKLLSPDWVSRLWRRGRAPGRDLLSTASTLPTPQRCPEAHVLLQVTTSGGGGGRAETVMHWRGWGRGRGGQGRGRGRRRAETGMQSAPLGLYFIREVCSGPQIHAELPRVMPFLQARKWKLI